MPIYEHYCPVCHTIFNFFSRVVSPEKKPACPKCGRKNLGRQISRFAAIGSKKQGDEEMEDFPFDESRMEQAMNALAGEAEHLDEDDPRAAAQLMRKMSDMAGLKFNDNMEEALARLEAGEDPDQIEQELGDLMEGDEMPFEWPGAKGGSSRWKPPRHDETLYDL